MLIALALVIGFAPSPEDEARRAEALLAGGDARDATIAFLALAKAPAYENDPRSVAWRLDVVRAARPIADRRQLADQLNAAVERANELRAKDPALGARVDALIARHEPFVR